MTDTPADAQILEGLRSGSREAFNALCHRYSGRLWRHVSRMVGRDAAAVEDVVQETLLAAARSARSLATDSRLWGWLSAIGHRQAALHWRKCYRQRDLTERIQPRAESGIQPDAELLGEEVVADVRRILLEMEPEPARLLLARYLDGQSLADLAQETQATLDALRKRLARAREDFRKRYQELRPGEPLLAGVNPLSPRQTHGELP